MVTSTQIATQLLNFSDTEYVSGALPDLEQRESILLDEDFMGIAINAPRQLDTNTASTIPVILASRYDGVRGWDIPLRSNCWLIAANPLDGQVSVAPCFQSEKAMESRGGLAPASPGPRPSDEELEGEAAQISWCQGSAQLNLPWVGGLWELTAVYFDWVSNTVPVKLLGVVSPPLPLASAVFPPTSSNSLPTYNRISSTPEAPSEGVSFITRFDADDEGVQHLYIGSSLRIRKRMGLLLQQPFQVLDCGKSRCVYGLIPLTLLVFGLNNSEYLRFSWQVPVYQILQEDVLDACLTLDAFPSDVEVSAGHYRCYLVLEGRVYGPSGFTVP